MQNIMRKIFLPCLVAGICLLFYTATAQNFSGTYRLQSSPQAGVLTIKQQPDGTCTGAFTGPNGSAQFHGQQQGQKIVGNLAYANLAFYAEVNSQGNNMVLTLMNYNTYQQPMPATATQLVFFPASSQPAVSQQPLRTLVVVINGQQLSEATINSMQRQYGVQMVAGRYWYDPVSGLWGAEGGPAAGSVLPNLSLGGPLRANASNGDTGIFLNGRQLPRRDLNYLQNIAGYMQPGRYWLDANGNAGREGGPALVNLIQLASQQNGYNSGGNNSSYGGNSGGNNTMHRNWYTGTGSGSDGNTSYVIGDGWSVIVD